MPIRTTPAVNDVLLFNASGNPVATNVPSQTIGKVQVSANTIVVMQPAGGSNVLTLGESAPDALTVAAGSQLNLSAAAGLTNLALAMAAGAKASLSGAMTFAGNAAAPNGFTLMAADAGGVTFNAGATFTQNCQGNVFGAGTANSVVFAAGAAFLQKAGNNPFAKSQPASVVVFQPGSLFSFQGNLTPSVSGRAYADLEINATNFSQSVSGSSLLTVSNLSVVGGVLNVGMNQYSHKGGITVAAGAALNFNLTNTFNGGAEQIISGAGAFALGTNAVTTIVGGSALTLSLQAGLALKDGTRLTNNGALNIQCALTGSGTINGAGPVAVLPSGTLAPGTGSGMGALAFATAPALNGTVRMKIDRNGGAPLADKLIVSW
jgi:hypothetical protein